MLGVIVNAIAVVIGSLLGLLFRKGVLERITVPVMTTVGLTILSIGILGLIKDENQLILTLSLVLGTIVGNLIDIDTHFEKFATRLTSKFQKENSGSKFVQGFVTATLLFCVGSMAVTGSINAGLAGDHSILFIKSVLDFCSACILTVSLGVGVMAAAISILVIQGGIALLAGVMSGVLASSSNEMIVCGSAIMIAIGLNLMGITKIKVANLIPALFFVPILIYLFNLTGISL